MWILTKYPPVLHPSELHSMSLCISLYFIFSKRLSNILLKKPTHALVRCMDMRKNNPPYRTIYTHFSKDNLLYSGTLYGVNVESLPAITVANICVLHIMYIGSGSAPLATYLSCMFTLATVPLAPHLYHTASIFLGQLVFFHLLHIVLLFFVSVVWLCLELFCQSLIIPLVGTNTSLLQGCWIKNDLWPLHNFGRSVTWVSLSPWSRIFQFQWLFQRNDFSLDLIQLRIYALLSWPIWRYVYDNKQMLVTSNSLLTWTIGQKSHLNCKDSPHVSLSTKSWNSHDLFSHWLLIGV